MNEVRVVCTVVPLTGPVSGHLDDLASTLRLAISGIPFFGPIMPPVVYR